ncbi:MAG: PAS domain-containing protein [Thermoguttaceae bacterium]
MLIAVGGLAASVGMYWALLIGQRRLIDRQFRLDAEQRVGVIQSELTTDLEIVRALSALYGASDEVERNEFHDFTDIVVSHHPSIRHLGWAPVVSASGRAEHEETTQESGLSDYRITQHDARGNLGPAGERDEYLPIHFLQSKDGGTVTLGFDLGSDPACRETMLRAGSSGELDATGCLQLGKTRHEACDLLVVVPIYGKNTSLTTAEQRQDQTQGYVFGVCRVGAIVEDALSSPDTAEMDLQLFDASLPDGRQRLYGRGPTIPFEPLGTEDARVEDDWSTTRGIHWISLDSPAGHEWLVCCRPTDRYVSAHRTWLPTAVLFAGIAVTALLTMYGSALTGRTAKVEQQVAIRADDIQRAKESLEREVAEHRQTEAGLRDSQAMYSSLVENLPVQVLRKDLEGRFTFANQSFCELLGKTLSAVLGKTDHDFYADQLADKYRRDDRRVVETGRLFEDVEEYRKDGQTRYVHVMKSAVRDASGKIIGTQAIFWDVTERKEAEAALAREQYLLHALMDNLPDAVYYKDRESRFLRISKSLADSFGMGDPSAVIGKTDADFFTDEHARQARADEEEVMRSGQALVGKEEKETWLDGHETWAVSTKLPLYDGEGGVIGTFGISRDITERKRAEEELLIAHEELEMRVRERTAELEGANQALQAEVTERKWAERTLRESEARLRQIIDLVPHMIFAKDRQGRFLLANRATADAYEMTVPELTGKKHAEVHPDQEELRQMLEADRAVIESGQPKVSPEESFVNAEGTLRYLQTIKIPYTASGTSEPAILGVSIDITELKHAEDELRKAHDELEMRVQQRTAELARANEELARAKETSEAASQAKSAFLANMSHEIRTPLNAIIGMTELVLDTALPLEQREYLTVVQESGETLLSLINNILDFSKIEADRLELDIGPFDLHETLADTMKLLAIRAHTKGLELVCHIPAQVPVAVVGDRIRLGQIVVNLVGNAIKFTESGEVVLDVQCQSQSQHDLVLHASVSDTGIGIARENLDTIFEEFEQADNTTTRKFGGSGLGLAIASKLVNMMGGRIWVESELGKGSTFHFTVRFGMADVDPVDSRAVQPPALDGMRVLVVDDNRTNCRILEEMLRNWEMAPTSVQSVPEALDALQDASATDRPYQLVLTDANMPETDGFALARRIRESPELAGTVIMMLTSGDRPGDIARCAELDVSAYLLKPIKQSELLDAITMVLGTEVSEEAAGDAKSAAAGPRQTVARRSLQVLLAEDSLVNQKLAVGLLKRRGHSVFVANNGAEAVAAWRSQPFDLIIMDVQMPEMDGLEATVAIRTAEKQTGRHIPIVAMTAHALKGDRERCLEAGMDQYMSKPIRAAVLFETIESLAGDCDATVSSPAEVHSTGRVVDWSAAMRTVKGDHDLLKDIIEALLQETPRLMASIRQAITDGDAEALRIAAHALKGAVRYLGADRAYQQALEIEQMGRNGNLEDASAALPTLQAEVSQMTPLLEDYLQGKIAIDDPPA